MNGTAVFCAALALVSAGTLAAAAADAGAPAATQPAAMNKLTAVAHVSVAAVAGAPQATLEYVRDSVVKAIPSECFAKLTVVTEGAADEARRKAMTDGAQVFLQVTVAEPKRLDAPKVDVRVGRRTREVELSDGFDRVRSVIGVNLSVSVGGAWRQAKALTLTSADAPPAETRFADSSGDFSRAWGYGAALTARAACKKALNEYFLNGVTMRAVEVEPVKTEPPPDPNAPDRGPRCQMKIELSNRSHCRIVEATVTVEQYNQSLESWERVGDTSPLGRVAGRGRGPAQGGQEPSPTWTVRAYVDPGQKAFSDTIDVSTSILLMMKNNPCRFVLHATPATDRLVLPSTLHPLRPDPAPKP